MIREAIYSGNLWGLKWGMGGVFHGSETPESVVNEAVEILVMWQRLEESAQNLKPEDKEWLAKNSLLGDTVHFRGFDGNNPTECQYISAARFLVERLDRFHIFKGRDFNAHMPTLDAYQRMLPVFDRILRQVLNKDFTAAQIAEVLAEYPHPESEATKSGKAGHN